MKRSDIKVGTRYRVGMDYNTYAVATVLEVGVARPRSTRKDGVRVRAEEPYARPYSLRDRMMPAGTERTVSTRDVECEWTAEREAARTRARADIAAHEARADAIRDALETLGIKARVTGTTAILHFDAAEKLLSLTREPVR